MIQFKLNGKKIQVLSSWDDTNYNQFIQIHDCKSLAERLAICTGLPVHRFESDIVGLETLLTAVSFIPKSPEWTDPVFKCGPFDLPINHKGEYNITFEGLGQFEDMRKLLPELKIEDSLMAKARKLADASPPMVAIYLQKIRDGEYDYNKAVEMIPEVKTMPAREVVTLGSFFLVKLLTLSTGTQSNSQNTPPSPKKSRRVSKGSNKSLARSPRSRK